MGAAANSPLRRRCAFWVLAVYGLALVAAVAWSVTSAVHLLNGPTVILPGDGYSAVAVTPDGRTLYVADTGPVSGASGHTVMPVDIATGKAGKPIALGTGPQGLAVTPDGRTLLVSDGTITPVNLATGRTMAPIHVPGGAEAMAVSPDSRTLFVGTGNNEVVAVDIATGHQDSPLPLPRPDSGLETPAALAVTPDGKTLYVAEYDGDDVIPVNLATGRPGTPIVAESFVLGLESALAITPDGKTLYVAVNGDYGGGSGPNSLVAISTASGTVEKTINYGTAGPVALAVTPGGRTLYALNGNYGESIVPETSTVTPVSTADGRLGGAIRTGGFFSHATAFGFAVAPDGRTVYVAQGDVVAIALPRLSALAGTQARQHPHRSPHPGRTVAAHRQDTPTPRRPGAVRPSGRPVPALTSADGWLRCVAVFLTSTPQRARGRGQEQQLHSTAHPKIKIKIKVKIKFKGSRRRAQVPVTERLRCGLTVVLARFARQRLTCGFANRPLLR